MNFTNKHNLPNSLVKALIGKQYDITKFNPYNVSVTTLINPPRINQLQRRHWHVLEDDASNRLWMLLGTAVHAVLERATDKHSFTEETLRERIGEYTLTGRPDRYDSIAKAVQDYKITSSWSIIFGKKEGKPEWAQQANIYAWLYNKAGFEVKELKIIAILRDWQQSKAWQNKDYPQIPIAIVKLKLWSTEEQERYIKERIDIHDKARKLADNKLPLCTPEERWAKAETYAIFKVKNLETGETNKKATKVVDTKKEANKYIEGMAELNDYEFKVEKREGEDIRCQSYCACNVKCNYYLKKYGAKK